ncbi:hypothetical protein [Escherichia coli]|uniref:hypothetical protein n=1 Tax=Escherichia coli TaxID=562 RepID=UPI003987EC7E
MTVGTNLDTVYFKIRHGQVTGNSAAFDFHPDFAALVELGISVEHLRLQASYGDLDPLFTGNAAADP